MAWRLLGSALSRTGGTVAPLTLTILALQSLLVGVAWICLLWLLVREILASSGISVHALPTKLAAGLKLRRSVASVTADATSLPLEVQPRHDTPPSMVQSVHVSSVAPMESALSPLPETIQPEQNQSIVEPVAATNEPAFEDVNLHEAQVVQKEQDQYSPAVEEEGFVIDAVEEEQSSVYHIEEGEPDATQPGNPSIPHIFEDVQNEYDFPNPFDEPESSTDPVTNESMNDLSDDLESQHVESNDSGAEKELTTSIAEAEEEEEEKKALKYVFGNPFDGPLPDVFHQDYDLKRSLMEQVYQVSQPAAPTIEQQEQKKKNIE